MKIKTTATRYFLGLILVHLFLLFSLRFTVWPEMFSFPYLKNNGFYLYLDMVHAYPPLLTLILAYTFKFVGYKIFFLKLIFFISVLISDIFIYLISSKIAKRHSVGLVSLSAYVFIHPFLEGNMLWFDGATTPFLLAALYFLVTRKVFLSGIFLSFCILTKQTALVFFLPFFFYIICKKAAGLKIFILGVALPFLPLFARLWQEGAVEGFFRWTIINPFLYWSSFPGYVQMTLSKRELLIIFLLLAPLLFAFFLTKKNWSFKKNHEALLVTVSLFFSFFAVYPRFSFFHAQAAIPLFSVLVGYFFFQSKYNKHAFVLAAIILTFFLHKQVLTANWMKEDRFYDKETLSLSEKIKSKTKKEEKIYLLGLPSNLYTLSDRLPTKPWVDNFGWNFEIPGVQEWAIEGFERQNLKAVFWKEAQKNGNWYDLGVYEPKKITVYILENFEKVEELGQNIWYFRRKE